MACLITYFIIHLTYQPIAQVAYKVKGSADINCLGTLESEFGASHVQNVLAGTLAKVPESR
jgi:hypothetical protein